MNFRKLIACLGFALCTGASAATAADLPKRTYVKAPVPVPVMTWTGFYAGLSVGYHDGEITQAGCTGSCPSDPKLTGAFLSAQAGADYQFENNVVLGAFLSIPLTRLKADVVANPGGFVFPVRPQFAGVAAARLGYAFNAFLPYAFVGAGFADVKARSPFGVEPSNTHVGVAFGAGVEYRLAQNWSVDLQYTRINLPKKQYDFGGGFEEFGENSNNFKLGVNYRF